MMSDYSYICLVKAGMSWKFNYGIVNWCVYPFIIAAWSQRVLWLLCHRTKCRWNLKAAQSIVVLFSYHREPWLIPADVCKQDLLRAPSCLLSAPATSLCSFPFLSHFLLPAFPVALLTSISMRSACDQAYLCVQSAEVQLPRQNKWLHCDSWQAILCIHDNFSKLSLKRLTQNRE